jgi:hypothetical protein
VACWRMLHAWLAQRFERCRGVLTGDRKHLRFGSLLDGVLKHRSSMLVARLPDTCATGVLHDAVTVEQDVKVWRSCIDIASLRRAGRALRPADDVPARSCTSCTYLLCTGIQCPSLGVGANELYSSCTLICSLLYRSGALMALRTTTPVNKSNNHSNDCVSRSAVAIGERSTVTVLSSR